MTTWSRTDLPATSVNGFVWSTLQPVKNGGGFLRLLCADYDYNVWCAVQRLSLLPSIVPPRFGGQPKGITWGTVIWAGLRPGIPKVVDIWQNLGAPVIPADQQLAFPSGPTICAATNGSGAPEVFTVGLDGLPYHRAVLPRNPKIESNFDEWTPWQQMPSWPPGVIVPLGLGGVLLSPIAVALIDDLLLFCCISTAGLVFDYQYPDPNSPTGYGWASTVQGALFNLPALMPAGQSAVNIALQPTGQGLQLYVQSDMGGIGGIGYYVSAMANIGAGWSAFAPVPSAPGLIGLPQIYPGATVPLLGSSVAYLPGVGGLPVGSLITLGDTSGGISFLRQLYELGPGGAYTQLGWSLYYEPEFPAGSISDGFPATAASEDLSADLADTSTLHMDLFFCAPGGLTVYKQEYKILAKPPSHAQNGLLSTWPEDYSPPAGSPPTIVAFATDGAFSPVNALAVILDGKGKQQLFGVQDGGTTVHVWWQP